MLEKVDTVSNNFTLPVRIHDCSNFRVEPRSAVSLQTVGDQVLGSDYNLIVKKWFYFLR